MTGKSNSYKLEQKTWPRPSSTQNRAIDGVIAIAATLVLYWIVNTAFANHVRNTFDFDGAMAVVEAIEEGDAAGSHKDLLFIDGVIQAVAQNKLIPENPETGAAGSPISVAKEACGASSRSCAQDSFAALVKDIASWPLTKADGWTDPPGKACDIHFARVTNPEDWVPKALDTVVGVRISSGWGVLKLYEPMPGSGLHGRDAVYTWGIVNRPDKPDADCTALLDRLARFDATVENMVEDLRSEVSWSRWWLLAFNGVIQIVIVFCAIWVAALTARRFAWLSEPDWIAGETRSRADDDDDIATTVQRYLDRSDRVFDQWLLNALPLLGFLGTVVGMIGAMGLIGGVVSAEAGPELESQVGALAGELSVAFYTTFLALAASLVLSLFQDAVFAVELRRGIDALSKEDENTVSEGEK